MKEIESIFSISMIGIMISKAQEKKNERRRKNDDIKNSIHLFYNLVHNIKEK